MRLLAALKFAILVFSAIGAGLLVVGTGLALSDTISAVVAAAVFGF